MTSTASSVDLLGRLDAFARLQFALAIMTTTSSATPKLSAIFN
jgi:hypothetical protein